MYTYMYIHVVLHLYIQCTIIQLCLCGYIIHVDVQCTCIYRYMLCIGNWVDKVVVDMMMKKENPKGDIKLYLYSAVSTCIMVKCACKCTCTCCTLYIS